VSGTPRRGLRQIQASNELPVSLGEQSLSQSVSQEAAQAQGNAVTAAGVRAGVAGQSAEGTKVSQQAQAAQEQREDWDEGEGYETGVNPGELERLEEVPPPPPSFSLQLPQPRPSPPIPCCCSTKCNRCYQSYCATPLLPPNYLLGTLHRLFLPGICVACLSAS